MADLSKVTIGIKTFLRDGKLFKAIAGIRRTMPEARMIIADDGEHTEEKDGVYADLIREGHRIVLMPFDAGFGAKSNAIANRLETPYLLIGSDDFDFSPLDVRRGIEKLVDIMDKNLRIDVASGRVNNNPYEFYLSVLGNEVFEIPREQVLLTQYSDLPYSSGVDCHSCDLTVNYSLIRSSVFGWVIWDDEVKIGGGEHGAFFYDLRRLGKHVVWVPGVNINEQEGEDSEQYKSFRRRSRSPERPCFKWRGIRKYVLGNGNIDYEEK